MWPFVFSIVFGLLIPSLLVEVNGQAIATTESPERVARCFQFTWLGPRWNNESIFLNATCADATRMAAGVPCFQPLVVSYDGSWPDVNYIWTNYGENASCILANNDVCATYTYYFNGHVENSTNMCTRVVDSNSEAITSGCFTQTNGSFSTRACFCRSIPGGLPCNGSGATAINASILLTILVVVSMLYKDLTY